MRVAICDDNQQDIERIRRYTLRMIDYAVEYVFYTRPEELLRECADAEQKPDMYILDIEMPGMDGLAVAKQIRETDSKALLVFLTSYTKYMPSVFEVVTFDFIPKPISEERLRVLFEKAGTYLNLTNQSFSFSYRRVRYSLKFDEILYLEKRGRQAIIHTKKMKYQSNMNLNEIWGKLDERMFAAVHGSFIVNLKHVHSVSSGMVMLTDGTELGHERGEGGWWTDGAWTADPADFDHPEQCTKASYDYFAAVPENCHSLTVKVYDFDTDVELTTFTAELP